MQRDNPQTALELRSLLAPILEAIELVRATASNLRPSSLDDLGLLSSLTFLWRKLAIERPDLNINYKLLLEEQEVPVALRETIFRTAEAASAAVAAMQSAKNAEFLLGMEDDKIVLTIHDDALPHCAVPDAQNPFSCVRDITTISGGNYFCNCTPLNGNVVKASWSY